MHCEGWYEETNHFGLVYRLPPTNGGLRCQSLGNILSEPKYRDLLRADLDNRLRLARALAWTLFELHSVDWVHKSIDPNNILLFGEEVGGIVQFNWSKPYLVGFDSSRAVTGLSNWHLNLRATLALRLYTHSDRQGNEYVRFKKIHDIYSLGVVLLELGRLVSFQEDGKRHLQESPQMLKTYLIEEARGLQTILGKTFSDIVLMCLNGQLVDAAQERLLTNEFRSQICGKLEQIRITVPNIEG
jgi:serine/threonine protein kinase